MASRRESCALWAQLEDATSKIGGNGTPGGTVNHAACRWGDGVRVDAANEYMAYADHAAFRANKGTLQIEVKPIGWAVVNGHSGGDGQHQVWMMYGSVPDTKMFFFAAGAADGFYWFVYDTAYTGFGTSGNAAPLMDGADGTVHSLLMVWDTSGIEGGSNTMEVYWDGVIVASTTNALAMPSAARSDWWVGNHTTAPAGGHQWDGTLGNLKCFDDTIRDRATGAHLNYEGWLMDERKGGGHVLT